MTNIDQGNTIHQIRGIQVFINKQLLGNFETPCSIPVRNIGECAIEIFPMVFINGSNNHMGVYSSLGSFLDTLTFKGTKAYKINPKFKYRSNVQMKWLEDFEDTKTTLVGIAPSPYPGDTMSIEKRLFNLTGRFNGLSNVMSVRFEDIDTAKYIDLGSFDEFTEAPLNGNAVFFEFDIKTEMLVQLALKRKNSTANEIVPYMVINSTKGEWKRFYVNLIYELQGQPPGTSFRLFFDINKPANFKGDREILFDNLRLSYLK